jgi:hypothetical protein
VTGETKALEFDVKGLCVLDRRECLQLIGNDAYDAEPGNCLNGIYQDARQAQPRGLRVPLTNAPDGQVPFCPLRSGVT